MVRWITSTRSHPNARRSRRATAQRTCGTVNAGVYFFSPPRLLDQEPRRHQGQGLVVLPTRPRPHLILPQTRLALGPLQTLLDAVLRLEHPRVLGQRRLHGRVGQQVIVLATAIGLLLAEYHQHLRHVRRLAFGACLHQPRRHLHLHRPLLALTHRDGLPRLRRLRRGPLLYAHEGHLRPPPPPPVRRRRGRQVAYQGVRRHRQQVA